MRKIILASASPRRKELLKNIGLKFEIDISNFKEDINIKLKPQKLAEFLSLQKAKDVAKRYKNAVVISADTVIIINNEIVGKPKDKKDAQKILKKLSGAFHYVVTGFTIIDTKSKKSATKYERTKVFFKKLTEEEIDAYIKTGEPLDKAGAYGIQRLGGIFVEKIEGDFFNVVGLPIFKLAENLKNEFGILIP